MQFPFFSGLCWLESPPSGHELALEIPGLVVQECGTDFPFPIYFWMHIYKYELGKHYVQTRRGLIFEAPLIFQELIQSQSELRGDDLQIYWAVHFYFWNDAFQSSSGELCTCAMLIMEPFVWKQDINRIKDFPLHSPIIEVIDCNDGCVRQCIFRWLLHTSGDVMHHKDDGWWFALSRTFQVKPE